MTIIETPVALFTFNRPAHTARVLDAIRAYRPSKLFLVNDGPRENSPQECDEVRVVLGQIDWPCDVQRNYATVNLGCRQRMISGLSWVFSQVNEAILLEDDCLPSPTFFQFCAENLDRYREDPKVMMISGSNLVASRNHYEHSYVFARSVGVWGWATWARAWRQYDEHLKDWPRLRETDWLLRLLEDAEQARLWTQLLDQVHSGHTTWDFQWLYTVWREMGVSVVPSRNMIQNIGFDGPRYDNPSNWIRWIASIQAEDLLFPLNHPPELQIDRATDARLFELAFAPQVQSVVAPSLIRRVIGKVRSIARNTLE